MIKLRYITILLLFVACVFVLFQVKFKVQNLHRELVEIKQQLEHEKNSVYILKAEWAYLNKPERLQRLAVKFLDLAELKSEQIILASNGTNKKSKDHFSRSDRIIKASYSSGKVKWRYKKRSDLGY